MPKNYRTRESYEQLFDHISTFNAKNPELTTTQNLNLMAGILLDIRDLLQTLTTKK